MELVVFDANVWVSSALQPGSVPDRAVDVVRSGAARSVISEELIAQVRRTLSGPKFTLPPDAVDRIEAEVRQLSLLVHPTIRLAVIAAKELDNRVLECAIAGNADVIVTGDRKHLLPLGQYDGIPILSPRDFLDFLERGDPGSTRAAPAPEP